MIDRAGGQRIDVHAFCGFVSTVLAAPNLIFQIKPRAGRAHPNRMLPVFLPWVLGPTRFIGENVQAKIMHGVYEPKTQKLYEWQITIREHANEFWKFRG